MLHTAYWLHHKTAAGCQLQRLAYTSQCIMNEDKSVWEVKTGTKCHTASGMLLQMSRLQILTRWFSSFTVVNTYEHMQIWCHFCHSGESAHRKTSNNTCQHPKLSSRLVISSLISHIQQLFLHWSHKKPFSSLSEGLGKTGGTLCATHHAGGAPYISRRSVSSTHQHFQASVLPCLDVLREVVVLKTQTAQTNSWTGCWPCIGKVYHPIFCIPHFLHKALHCIHFWNPFKWLKLNTVQHITFCKPAFISMWSNMWVGSYYIRSYKNAHFAVLGFVISKNKSAHLIWVSRDSIS